MNYVYTRRKYSFELDEAKIHQINGFSPLYIKKILLQGYFPDGIPHIVQKWVVYVKYRTLGVLKSWLKSLSDADFDRLEGEIIVTEQNKLTEEEKNIIIQILSDQKTFSRQRAMERQNYVYVDNMDCPPPSIEPTLTTTEIKQKLGEKGCIIDNKEINAFLLNDPRTYSHKSKYHTPHGWITDYIYGLK